MVVLTSDVVHSRLQDIKNPTQEAIETMSLWIMHYKDKASIDLIVDGWLNCFKTAGTDEKRVALFYVMNDVVQKAKMKHADMLIPAFQPAILTAVGVGRKQDKVKNVMKRCIQIFKSRNVFAPASITAMENLLDEAYDAEDQALEIDADDLVKKITSFVSARNVIGDMMRYVNEGDFDYKEKCRSGMKDREEGAHILQEVHEAIDTMVQVRHSMENQKKKMMALSETLELAKRVFLHQKREVLVVEEAYVNFRDGIKAVHTELVEMEEKGVYPGGILSPAVHEDDHHFNASSSHADDHYRPQVTSWGDNRMQVDMEMDDEERPSAPMMKPSLQALVGIASQPSLQSRIMQLGLKKLADGDEEMLQHSKVPPAASADFTRPPPAVFGGNSNVNPFGGPLNAPAPSKTLAPPPISVPTDPRKRVDADGPSQYALALQQHGLVAPKSQTTPIVNKPTGFTAPEFQNMQAPPPQPVYQAQFEQTTRDPRLLSQQNQQPPPIAGYRAQFETRVPPPQQQTGYQASFDTPPPKLVSPTLGGYQARFEHQTPKSMFEVIPGAHNNGTQPQSQFHQNSGGGFRQQEYSDYNSGERNDIDNRFDRREDRGGYHQQPNRQFEDRRSTPYSNPRGGGDRYRAPGGGFNDRNRRDNWRGGHNQRGGYHNNNRY